MNAAPGGSANILRTDRFEGVRPSPDIVFRDQVVQSVTSVFDRGFDKVGVYFGIDSDKAVVFDSQEAVLKYARENGYEPPLAFGISAAGRFCTLKRKAACFDID